MSRAADCAMCAMLIMTSKNMNKRVYIDDVIDKVTQFVRFQLQNTIYPSYDPVYRFVFFYIYIYIYSAFLLLKTKNKQTNILSQFTTPDFDLTWPLLSLSFT